VLDILRQTRSNCENVFHKIFDQAKNECEKYDAPLLIPRTCKSQIFRDNYPSDDPEHFFREAICGSPLLKKKTTTHLGQFRKSTGQLEVPMARPS